MVKKPDRKIIDVVRKFKDSESKKYGIEEIVLFGSQAEGTASQDSDVDLIVIVKDEIKDKAALMTNLVREWHSKPSIDLPVDFLPYSRREFAEMAGGVNIVSQALKNGTVI